jgi:hypothetical protein
MQLLVYRELHQIRNPFHISVAHDPYYGQLRWHSSCGGSGQGARPTDSAAWVLGSGDAVKAGIHLSGAPFLSTGH